MAAKKVNRRQIATISNYRELFTTPLGKKVLMDMCRQHYIFGNNLEENPIILAQSMGEQTVIRRILAYMRVNLVELNEEYEQYERELREED